MNDDPSTDVPNIEGMEDNESNIINRDDSSGCPVRACFADPKDTTCSLDNNDEVPVCNNDEVPVCNDTENQYGISNRLLSSTNYVELSSNSSDTDSSRDWASYTETESSSNSDNSDYIDDSDITKTWPHERKEQDLEKRSIGYEKLNVYQSDDEVANKSSRKSSNIMYRHKRYLSV